MDDWSWWGIVGLVALGLGWGLGIVIHCIREWWRWRLVIARHERPWWAVGFLLGAGRIGRLIRGRRGLRWRRAMRP